MDTLAASFFTAFQVGLVPAAVVAGTFWTLGAARAAAALAVWSLTSDSSERSGGAPWHRFRQHAFWSAAARYFRPEISGSRAVPGEPVIFLCHPHGALALAGSLLLTREGFAPFCPTKDWRIAATRAAFIVPMTREVVLWSGGVTATEEGIENALDQGLSVCVFGGGAAEALLPDALMLRRGLVRLGVRRGTPLVPVYTSGETGALRLVSMVPSAIQAVLRRRFQMVMALPWGRGPLVPRRVRLHTRVGPQVVTRGRVEADVMAELQVILTRLHAEGEEDTPLRFVSKL